jgi:NAD(P)-dependent dehydrogenase (short-subunit alcohol dehydrogenase family)
MTGGKNMSQGKVVLVTGVSSGIGKAVAGLLSRSGFRVFGTTRGNAEPRKAAEGVELVRLDVRDGESVRSCVRTVLDRAGRIEALVNNAGYTLIGSLEETSIEEAKQLFETNFFGVLRMTQAVLPFMRGQRSGRIVNVGSVVGIVPAPYQGIYSASKHALEGYSESLDHEVRQFGIRVSTIEPSFTRTNIAQNSQAAASLLEAYAGGRNRVLKATQQNIAKGGTAQGVAEVVLRALTTQSPQSRYPVGREAKFVTRLWKFGPSRLFDWGLRRQFQLDAV